MPENFQICVEAAGKKFGKEWIFHDVTMQLDQGGSYAILGNNGSGKSTLLMCISGFYALSKGRILNFHNEKPVEDSHAYKHYALISPLLELPEDFTMHEFLEHHFSLKPLKAGWDLDRIYRETGLEAARNKFLKHLSSGMRQRIKLAVAFTANVPVIFLDEPCTNLDKAGISWYRSLVEQSQNQVLVVASNMEDEYSFCRTVVHMDQLKKK